jgi:hypothetical protein
VFRFARAWLWHMVARFLFSDGSGNTTSWLVLPILCLEWDAIATYSQGLLHLLGCTVCCAMGSRGVVRASTLEGAHTSYRSSYGNISRSLGRTATTRRYVLRSFSLYIFFVNCLANNLKFNLQSWPFNDAAS